MNAVRRGLQALAVAAVAAMSVAPAGAQTPGPTPIGRTRTWEIEGYGGFPIGRVRSGGTSALPNPGPPITTSSPIFPSRQVPSWFLGDGTTLLNDVLGEFGLPGRVTPLDQALTTLGLQDAGSVLIGARVRRHLTPHYAAEFSLDVMATSPEMTGALLAAAETSRATFESAMASLLLTGPFVNPVVTATRTLTTGSSREMVLTGAINMFFASAAGFTPYATAGAGVILPGGELPAVTIEGRYRFSINGTVPIDETDRTVVRHDQTPTLAGVFGGGVRRDVSEAWGFSLDGRVFVSRTTTRLLIETTPSSVTGTPAGFIESLTYPNLQFSNNASTGRQSTLSAPGLKSFEAFAGGLDARFRLTAGLYVKF